MLARRIGLFDATMVVMGGIVGSGIFVNPAIVARSAGAPWLMIAAWLTGGVAAMIGAFVYAELSRRRPQAGGQYVYLRDAFHPGVAFLYGWALLVVIQTGGMAACAIVFARYLEQLVPLSAPESLLAAVAMAALTLINCLGVKAGSRVQSALMVLKIAAITALVCCGLLLAPAPAHAAAGEQHDFGTALIPVLFAYGGFQTSCFVAAEMNDPQRDLPRALIAGVGAVIALYTLTVLACLRTLGAAGLAATDAPAHDVAVKALGSAGGAFIAAGIAISTLGFLSQSILTAPRVYFKMAEDGLFPRVVGSVHPRTLAPVAAIVLQGALAAAIALLGTYEIILRYVVAIDFIFFSATAACLFVFARRGEPVTMPGHPFTTLVFIGISLSVVVATFVHDPVHSAIGLTLTLAGLPVYLLWRKRRIG
ncbi:MAG TPA: amino acid permease [Myxococcales bacterium]|nr:amino acid permease [Myxococcales bacterium]